MFFILTSFTVTSGSAPCRSRIDTMRQYPSFTLAANAVNSDCIKHSHETHITVRKERTGSIKNILPSEIGKINLTLDWHKEADSLLPYFHFSRLYIIVHCSIYDTNPIKNNNSLLNMIK